MLDLDKVISPGNHYDETVNGQDCRFDGIHFSIYCASLLQPYVLGACGPERRSVTRNIAMLTF
jgi:hypothetical protein